MSKIVPGAVILALVVAVVLLAGSGFQQQQTTATLAQTTLEQGRALEASAINDVFQTLISLAVLMCGGMTVLIGGAAVAFWRMTTNREKQLQALIAQLQGGQQQPRQSPGRWVSGPNANWGRVQQPNQGQQIPYLPYPQPYSQPQLQQPTYAYYQPEQQSAMDGIYWEAGE